MSAPGNFVKFAMLAAAMAGAIQFGAHLNGLPPGSAAFVLAPGQASTSMGLGALGHSTDIFAVGDAVLDLEVRAPEGHSFVFEGGARGKSSAIKLYPNSRASYLFSVSSDTSGSEPKVREVRFASWSASRGHSLWGKPPAATRHGLATNNATGNTPPTSSMGSPTATPWRQTRSRQPLRFPGFLYFRIGPAITCSIASMSSWPGSRLARAR